MDKALRPDRFECLPNEPSAGKDFVHWLRTFENFLDVLPKENLDKLKVLTNFLSSAVFEIVNECTSYESAVELLRSSYVKTKNEVFARHLLSIRKQQPGESLDQYLQELKRLSKDCNFTAVSASEHREQYIRDAFIAGLQSNSIRQRLLESNSLQLQTMFDQARTLDVAQQSMDSFAPVSYENTSVNAAINRQCSDFPQSSQECSVNSVQQSQEVVRKDTCWNCGNASHARSKCPARNIDCFSCGRKGHLAKYCRFSKGDKNSSNASSAAMNFPTIA